MRRQIQLETMVMDAANDVKGKGMSLGDCTKLVLNQGYIHKAQKRTLSSTLATVLKRLVREGFLCINEMGHQRLYFVPDDPKFPTTNPDAYHKVG